MNAGQEPLRLPQGYELFSFSARQVAAEGAIYLARFPGDLATLFGPVRDLRDREFMLDLDGQQWIATPMPALFLSTDADHVFDAGGIIARTDGEVSTIDFSLLRKIG